VETPKNLSIDITNLEEHTKVRLRGMIKFFSGDRTNIKVQVVDNGDIKPCGTIYATREIIKQFEEVMGEERIKVL
jgi:hypothetical protein